MCLHTGPRVIDVHLPVRSVIGLWLLGGQQSPVDAVPGSARSGQCHSRSGVKTLSRGPPSAGKRACGDRICSMAAPAQSSRSAA
jgi:hypothetical protein